MDGKKDNFGRKPQNLLPITYSALIVNHDYLNKGRNVCEELVFRLLFHCLRIHIVKIFDMSKNEEEKIANSYFYQELQKKRL